MGTQPVPIIGTRQVWMILRGVWGKKKNPSGATCHNIKALKMPHQMSNSLSDCLEITLSADLSNLSPWFSAPGRHCHVNLTEGSHSSQKNNTLWHSRKNLVTPCLFQSLSCYGMLTAAWQWLCVGVMLGIHTPNNSALLPTALDGTQESDHRDCPKYTEQTQRNWKLSTPLTEDDCKGRHHQKNHYQLEKKHAPDMLRVF